MFVSMISQISVMFLVTVENSARTNFAVQSGF